jgi:hypothetical protein
VEPVVKLWAVFGIASVRARARRGYHRRAARPDGLCQHQMRDLPLPVAPGRVARGAGTSAATSGSLLSRETGPASAILFCSTALGSRLDQDQNATTLARATAEAKLAASLS